MLLFVKIMNQKQTKQFREDVLNGNLSVREALKTRIPQIGRLESLEELRNLRITGLRMTDDNLCIINYETIASPGLYPHVRARLIERGVISEKNALYSSIGHKGQSDEYERVSFGISGASVQVFLTAYNPNYKE